MVLPNTAYANVDAHLVNTGGGCVAISVAAGSTVPCYSVPLPAKIAYISQGFATASVVRWGVNASVTASLGAVVPTVVAPSLGTPASVEVAIDDVSKIWVYSAVAACLGITYVH
jgi:hypothetical protein